MKSKRGVTQTQFNWIFIMIAGALILLFFISMVYKQKSVSEQKTDIIIQKNFQEILTQAEISKQTEQIITAPEKEFRYNCEGFSIGSLAAFNPRIVFAPNLLKSNTRELIFYSLEWRVPFRIANFLYITSPEVRYVIVDDNGNLNDKSIANQLYDLLPENMNKGGGVVSENTVIYNENNYKIKKVCFDNKCDLNLNNINSDISEVNIIGEDMDGYGKIKIDNEEVDYLKKESVVAAVFSEDAEIYECNMKKAIERLKKVYSIYENRYRKLNSGYGGEDNCKSLYISSDLFNVKAKYGDIYSNIEKIKDKNDAAALLSCALIY